MLHDNQTGQANITAQPSGGRISGVERELREVVEGVKRNTGKNGDEQAKGQRAEQGFNTEAVRHSQLADGSEQSVEPKHRKHDLEIN